MLSHFGIVVLFGATTLPPALRSPENIPQSGGSRQTLGTSSFRHEGNIIAAAITKDGSLCATAADDETVAVWDTQSGKKLTAPTGHRGKILALAVSDDGQALLGGSQDGRLHLWKLRSGELLQTLEGHAGPVRNVFFHPTRDRVLSCCDDNSVRLWDSSTGKEVARPYEGKAAEVRVRCALADHGNTFAVTEGDNFVRLIETGSGRELHRIQAHAASIASISFSQDGRKLLTTGNDGIAVWDVASAANLVRKKSGTAIFSACFIHDDKRVAASLGDEVISLLDVSSGEVQSRLPIGKGYPNSVTVLVASKDVNRLLSAGVGNSIQVWDTTSGKQVSDTTGHRHHVTSLSWSEDSGSLASGSDDCELRIWRVQEGREVARGIGHDHWINATLYLAKQRMFVSAGQDGKVFVWPVEDPVTGKPLWKCEDSIRAIAGAPLKGWLAAGLDTGKIAVISIDGGTNVRVIDAHEGKVLALACSPDGTLMASGGEDGKTYLWDPATWKRLRTLSESNDAVTSVALSPDSNRIATVSKENQLVVRDRASGHVLLATQPRMAGGSSDPHGRSPSQVEITPDGRYVAYAGGEDSCRLWEIESGRLVMTVKIPGKTVYSLALSPDNRRLALGLSDTTILTASLDPGDENIPKASPDQLWEELASVDAAGAYRAVWQLARMGADAVPILAERLKSLSRPSIQQTILKLDDDDAVVRETAAKALVRAGDSDAISEALEATKSGERIARLKTIQQVLKEPVSSNLERQRMMRAIEALEKTRTASAKEVLRRISEERRSCYSTAARAASDRSQ